MQDGEINLAIRTDGRVKIICRDFYEESYCQNHENINVCPKSATIKNEQKLLQRQSSLTSFSVFLIEGKFFSSPWWEKRFGFGHNLLNFGKLEINFEVSNVIPRVLFYEEIKWVEKLS